MSRIFAEQVTCLVTDIAADVRVMMKDLEDRISLRCRESGLVVASASAPTWSNILLTHGQRAVVVSMSVVAVADRNSLDDGRQEAEEKESEDKDKIERKLTELATEVIEKGGDVRFGERREDSSPDSRLVPRKPDFSNL